MNVFDADSKNDMETTTGDGGQLGDRPGAPVAVLTDPRERNGAAPNGAGQTGADSNGADPNGADSNGADPNGGPDVVAMSESALAEAARRVADNPDVKVALQAVVDLAMANCNCEGASVTLVGANGGAESSATSDDLVEQADDLQYAYDEGPCLAAAEEGGAFLIVNARTDARFPKWGPEVAELGFNSVLSIHLFTDRRILGALNLYYATRDDFTPDEVEVAKVVAAHASIALAKLRSERDLWRAIDSRHLIGQAQGILMERFKLSPEKSFSVLRRYSQQHNVKLHDVAAELIRTGKLPAGAVPPAGPADPSIAG